MKILIALLALSAGAANAASLNIPVSQLPLAKAAHQQERFALPVDEKRVLADFDKVSVAGVDVYTLDVRSPTALSLGITIEALVLPLGAELEVVGAEETVKPTGDDLKQGWFRTPSLAGDSVQIKLRVPAGAVAGLRVDRVLVGLRGESPINGAASVHPLLKAYELKTAPANAPKVEGAGNGGSGVPAGTAEPEACYRNFACFKDAQTSEYGDSTVRILTSSGFSCSGTLIMNTARDFRPIISTAVHCFDGEALDVMARTQIAWRHEEPCGSLEYFKNSRKLVTSGVKVHFRGIKDDVAFLESSVAPPNGANPYWVGYDASEEGMSCVLSDRGAEGSGSFGRDCTFPSAGAVHGIDHGRAIARSIYSPRGMVMTNGGISGTEGRYSGDWVASLNEATDGLVRKGSSGGGLLYNGRIIGVVGSGGSNDGCEVNGAPGSNKSVSARLMDWFGGYTKNLPEVGALLDPSGRGILKIDGGRNPARQLAPVFVVNGPSEIKEGAVEGFSVGGATGGACTLTSALRSSTPAQFKVGDQFTLTGTSVGSFPVAVRCVGEGGQSSEVVKNVTVTKGASSGSAGGEASGGGSFGLAMSLLMSLLGLMRFRRS